jgi:hypothetical protein
MQITHIEDLFQTFIISGRFKNDESYVDRMYSEAKIKLYENYSNFVEQPQFKDEFLLSGKIEESKIPSMYTMPDEEPDVQITLRLPVFIKLRDKKKYSATKDDYKFE